MGTAGQVVTVPVHIHPELVWWIITGPNGDTTLTYAHPTANPDTVIRHAHQDPDGCTARHATPDDLGHHWHPH
jgi:hypothetical protein